MLRTRNHYCSNCLSTQRFLDLGECLVCERCTKQLERSVVAFGGSFGVAFGVIEGTPIAAVQCPPSAPRPRAPRPPLPRRESA